LREAPEEPEQIYHTERQHGDEHPQELSTNPLRVKLVTGYLQDEETWADLGDWVAAARVAAAMRDNRLGVLGHYYCGMLDVYTDVTVQLATFGGHVEIVEMCELAELRRAVTTEDV
jgi:L-arabinose isomerase